MRLMYRLLLIAVLLWTPARSVLADTGTHVVQPGETLFRIALNSGVSVDALRAANGLAGNLIFVGQTLIIPGAGVAAAPTQPAPEASSGSGPVPAVNGTHVVQAGENLFRIGLKYGVAWQAIQAANNMATPYVYAGQTLIIPGDKSDSGAQTTSAPPEPAASAPPAPAGGGKHFLVILSQQMLYAYEGDTLVRSTPISSGLWPNVTVVGTFYIYVKYTAQRMVGPGYDLPGVPYVMYFYQGYALHGTYWHHNFGHPMSHGCVNMPTDEAEWAFNWAPIGTPVTVEN
jgi:LysM repeat protein